MKKMITTIAVLTALTTQAQNKTASSIAILESQKQYAAAMILAATEAQNIYSNMKAEQVIASVKSQLNEIRKEIVTETHTTSGSFSVLFGLLSGGASERRILTEIMVMNPTEVSKFSNQVQNDFTNLKTLLRNYAAKNQSSIVATKLLAAKSIDLYLKMEVSERKDYSNALKEIVQKVSAINFYGLQEISHCISTEYLAKTQATNMSLSGFLISLNLEETKVSNARTKQTCSEKTLTASTQSLFGLTFQIRQADAILSHYEKQMGLSELLNSHPEFYPMWGL